MSPGNRVVALDWDGTLVDCMPKQWAVLAHVCAEQAVDAPPPAEWWRLKRSGLSTQVALVRMGWTLTLASAVATRWRELVEDDAFARYDQLCADSVRAVAAGHYAGLRFAVVSARSRPDAMRSQVCSSLLHAFIDEVCTVDPTNAASAKGRELGRLSPLCFVGDSETDYQAAELAHVPFIGVSCGQRSEGFLREQGAAVVVSTVSKALRLVTGCPGSPSDGRCGEQ